jgi:hypothetical protein
MFTWSQRIEHWKLRVFGQAQPNDAYARFTDELNEFITACQEGTREQQAEEAADIVITLCGFLSSIGYDLATIVYMKEFINERREWVSNGNGTGKHVKNRELDAQSRAIFKKLWDDEWGQQFFIMSRETPRVLEPKVTSAADSCSKCGCHFGLKFIRPGVYWCCDCMAGVP